MGYLNDDIENGGFENDDVNNCDVDNCDVLVVICAPVLLLKCIIIINLVNQ